MHMCINTYTRIYTHIAKHYDSSNYMSHRGKAPKMTIVSQPASDY